MPAKPVQAPPSANPSASSVDLFFELQNGGKRFQLGECVGAALALRTGGESLVVPWSSVLIDIYGGTWVYENTAAHQFVRRRVQVSRVVGDVFPEFAPPLVEVQTEAPGLSTEEVESLITVPLENAVNGVAWLKTVRSKTVLGLSSVIRRRLAMP